jgi:DNA-binding NtrC family response regulator
MPPAPAHLLVIADDEHVRALLAAVLRADGHDVDVATDRAHAVGLIETREYAVVLSDLRMPGLEGPALAAVLEARRAPSTLIFLSRPVFVPDFARFLIKSAAPVLAWPAIPADVSQVVARALATTPAPAESLR